MSTYERLVNSQNFFSPYLTQEDLSRLGRNHLESGEFIEMVFPYLNVRFISITDRFDSLYKQADISVQIKNLLNERYAKDVSKKICSVMESMQKQGKYVGSKAPYGYLRDPMDKHHLVIDPEAAPIVPISGRSFKAISSRLMICSLIALRNSVMTVIAEPALSDRISSA